MSQKYVWIDICNNDIEILKFETLSQLQHDKNIITNAKNSNKTTAQGALFSLSKFSEFIT